MSLAAFVKAKQMLTWHHSGGASEKLLNSLFYLQFVLKNLPHIIPAFVLTQLLQSKLAQIKPHPFSNHFSHLRFTCVSCLVDWFEIFFNLLLDICLELSSCQWLAVISGSCGRYVF